MTVQNKEPCSAEVEEALRWADHGGGYYERTLAAEVRRLRAAHQAPQAEPVAFLHADGYWVWNDKPENQEPRGSWWRLPVYTTPQAVAAVGAQAAEQGECNWNGGDQPCSSCPRLVTALHRCKILQDVAHPQAEETSK